MWPDYSNIEKHFSLCAAEANTEKYFKTKLMMREDSKEFFSYHKMLANNLKRKDLDQMI